MKNWNPEVNLYEPNRQSPVAIIVILFQLVQRLIRQFWPILLVMFLGRGGYENYWLNNVVIVFGLGSTLTSIISYFKFYFYIKNEELVIEKGVFQKSKINVPFDRIQTVNLQQNPIHRFFDVMALEIDTAGSAGNELSIKAINRKNAEEIRSFLLEKSRLAKAEKGIEGDEVTEGVASIVQKETSLLNLSISDLLKIGIGQNHFRRALIIVGSLFAAMEYARTIIGASFETQIKEVAGLVAGSAFLIALIAVPLMIAGSILLTLIQTVLRYYDLNFLKTQRGFKVVAGLLTKREQSANLTKIQQIAWSTNPVKMIFNLFDLKLSQAASVVVARKQSFYVPGCYAHQIEAVQETYFPGVSAVDFEMHGIHRSIMWRRWLYIGLLPAAFAFLGVYLSTEALSIFPIFWIIIVFLYQYRYWKKWNYGISEEGIRTSSGVIGTQWDLLLWYKIQSVKIKQTIYQRRKGLCDLVFYTAAGGIKIPYIELEKAQQIRNYVLYKIESSQKAWM